VICADTPANVAVIADRQDVYQGNASKALLALPDIGNISTDQRDFASRYEDISCN
jgi:hypothetical protein